MLVRLPFRWYTLRRIVTCRRPKTGTLWSEIGSQESAIVVYFVPKSLVPFMPKSLVYFGPKYPIWQPTGRIFELGTQNGCNKNLGLWGREAGRTHDLEELSLKELTWHSARLTFSILLQDKGVDPATVALLLGHTTTKYVLDTYKRHRPKDQLATIVKLPEAQWQSAYQ